MALRIVLSVFLATALLCGGLTPARADAAAKTPHVEIRLIAERSAVSPGATLTVALRQTIAKGWHTYWVNPGDAGEATHVEWRLPQGFAAGALQWPAPQRIDLGPLTNYGYEGEAVLLADIKIPQDLTAGATVAIGAHVTWQVCKDICIPEEAQLTLDLPVVEAEPAVDPLWQNVFDAARLALPRPLPLGASFVQDGAHLSLRLNDAALAATIRDVALFPLENGAIKNSAAQKWVAGGQGRLLQLTGGPSFSKPQGERPEHFGAVLVATDRTGMRMAFALDAARDAAASGAYKPVSWIAAFGAALLGGLLLNLMPCVFPVLSMKIVALARLGDKDARILRRDGLGYGLGVIAGFMLVGATLLILRQGGAQIGWGFQLQSPVFVSCLTLLFLGLGLNLIGAFEFNLPTISRREIGSVATGLLAVVVASPCTVPFMAAAVGAAALLPPLTSLLIFAGLGLGMAAPFMALDFLPGVTRHLPRPGPWMARLKQLMAFAMFGSAAWLLWVLSVQTGRAGLALVLGAAVTLALAAWAFGECQRGAGRWARWVWPGAALASALFVAGAALAPPPSIAQAQTPYEDYSPARLAQARAQGQPVFIDVTADWCITCKVNERLVFETAPFELALKAHRIAYLRADWTRRDDAITQLLSIYGRNGVPLYLFFPPGAPQAEVLPQVLTLDAVLGVFSTRAGTDKVGALDGAVQLP